VRRGDGVGLGGLAGVAGWVAWVVGPGAGLGLVLALLAAEPGFCVPVGGARAITEAILRRLQEARGQLRLGTQVEEILVRGGRAVGVRDLLAAFPVALLAAV